MKEISLNDLIASRLRHLRTRLGESGAAFGLRLEPYMGKPWSRQTVFEAEKGEREFRVEELFALAAAGKVPVQYLLTPPRGVAIAWKSGTLVKAAQLINLLREPGQPTTKGDEVKVVRRLVKEAQDRLRNADEYLKFIGDPEDAK